MAAGFVYRCPNTGLNVQGWIESEPADGETDLYEAVIHEVMRRSLAPAPTALLFPQRPG